MLLLQQQVGIGIIPLLSAIDNDSELILTIYKGEDVVPLATHRHIAMTDLFGYLSHRSVRNDETTNRYAV